MLLLHDNDLTGHVEYMCGDDAPQGLEVFSADCGGSTPEIGCSCCTACCQDGKDDCVRGDLLATFDLTYENFYQRDQYVFSEDLVFRTQAAGDSG